MTYIFLAIVVGVICFAILKTIKTRKLPSNKYTPFDDITHGKSDKD